MQEKKQEKFKILFYDVKSYDRESMSSYLEAYPALQMDFVESGDAEPFRVNSGFAWLAPENNFVEQKQYESAVQCRYWQNIHKS